MRYNYKDVPLNKEVWGYAYEINPTMYTLRLSKEPVEGKVKEEIKYNVGYSGHTVKRKVFKEIKKNGELKSGSVSFNARWYADTYEEAVEGYNKLIESHVAELEKLLNKAKSYKIN